MQHVYVRHKYQERLTIPICISRLESHELDIKIMSRLELGHNINRCTINHEPITTVLLSPVLVLITKRTSVPFLIILTPILVSITK